MFTFALKGRLKPVLHFPLWHGEVNIPFAVGMVPNNAGIRFLTALDGPPLGTKCHIDIVSFELTIASSELRSAARCYGDPLS